MRSHPEKEEFGVYGFGEEDEAIERASSSVLLRFRKRKLIPNAPGEGEQTPDFLQDFGGSKSLNHSGGLFGLKSSSMDHTPSTERMSSPGSDYSKKTQGKDPGIMIYDCIGEDPSDMRASFTVNGQHSVLLPELASVERESSSDESGSQISSSSPHHSSDDGENEGSLDPMHLSDLACAKDTDIDAAVIVTPDFVVYQNELHAECHLTFSVDSITIECLDTGSGDGPLKFEWAVADLLFIGCCWNGVIKTAYIEVRMKGTDLSLTTQASGYSFSGTLCLTFTVRGSQWLIKEQKIWSLNPKYKELWKAEVDVSGDKLSCNMGKSISFYPRQQLNLFEETLEDVVYPQGDPDAVSISRRDIELLRPETFINDTIIDFYIKYLLDKIPRNERNRFHFFNSFFFRKLADLDKDPKSVVGGRAAFLRVRKWTRKVNIFEKAYIFIPVNFNLHWSLLVICNPGEINDFKDEDIDNSPRVPCILHMDSIRGSHSGLKGLVQSYLWEEWKERHPECAEEDSTNFLNLRFVSLELPQQENYFDCGLFLLHYAELFLKVAPINFSPFKITRLSNFLSADWFIPAEASFKRFLLRNLLYELLGNTNRIVPSHPSTGDCLSLDDVNKTDLVEVLPKKNTIPASSLGEEDVKIGLELFQSSSVNIPTYSHDGQLKQPLLDLKAVEGDGSDQNSFTFEPIMPLGTSKCMMPTILEDEDFVQQETWQASFQELNGTKGERCQTSSLGGEPDEEKVSGSSKVVVQLEEKDDDNASSMMPNLRSGWESEQVTSRSDTNDDDSLPSQNSRTLCSSDEEKIRLISSDDHDQDVSAGGTLEGHCVEGGLAVDPSGPVALCCKDDEAEHQSSMESEIPENCTVEDSECDDHVSDADSSKDEVKNATLSLGKEWEVIPDSPERKLIANNDKETPEAMAAICLSSDTSADAGDSSVKFLDGIRDDENPEKTNDALEQQHPKKRQRTQHPRVERKQTRSTSRTLSFRLL